MRGGSGVVGTLVVNTFQIDTGRATTRAHLYLSPREDSASSPRYTCPQTGFPYYTTNRTAKPVYGRGRGGCGRGDGALVATLSGGQVTHPCPPPLFSLFEMY